MENNSCIECGGSVKKRRGKSRVGRGKYCSRLCMYQSPIWRANMGRGHVGQTTNWVGKTFTKEHRKKIGLKSRGNKHALGHKHTPEALKKIAQRSFGANNSNWLGDKVGYTALHMWVRRWRGTPNVCEFCGKSGGRMHWANKSHKYMRDLNDWLRLCPPCHGKYDRTYRLTSV